MIRILRNIGDRLRIRSIQTLISIVFSCLIVFIISSTSFISYYMTGNVVEKSSAEYVMQLIKQVNYSIQYYLDNVETISKNLSYNLDIQNFIANKKGNEDYDYQSISRYLNTFVRSRSDILNIFIFTEDGRVISNDPDIKIKSNIDFRKEPWYTRAMKSDGLVISGSHVQNIVEGEYKWVVSCSRQLRSYDGKQKLGVLLIDINFNLINDMCSNIELGKRGYVFILDSDGNIVYHPKQQLIYSNLKKEEIGLIMKSQQPIIMVEEEGVKKQYTVTSSPYSGWRVVGAVYIDDIWEYKFLLRNFFFLLGIISLIISVLISVLISRQVFHPIKKLVDVMNKFETGMLDVSVDIRNNNEIGELGKAFNYMIQEIKGLIRQIQMEQEQKRMSELKALQAQINPHFLYNTLDSIVWMAEAKKFKEVTTMTSSLAKLFRISISKGEEFIPVEDEIEHVVNYLTIQKIRYSKKLDYEIYVDESIRKYRIVKLILQPLVENAIYHGIKNMIGSGKIIITGEEKDGKLLFEVYDNGVGMTEETIKQLFEESHPKGSRLGGVGVRNVDERIKLYYGPEYGLEIESELYEGTTVRIWLPKKIPQWG